MTPNNILTYRIYHSALEHWQPPSEDALKIKWMRRLIYLVLAWLEETWRTFHFRRGKGNFREVYTLSCGTHCHLRRYFKNVKFWMDYLANWIKCFGNSSSTYCACSILYDNTNNMIIQFTVKYSTRNTNAVVHQLTYKGLHSDSQFFLCRCKSLVFRSFL